MQFGTDSKGCAYLFPTRKVSYRDRLLNTAIFLFNYLSIFELHHENHNVLRSVCALLPLLLSSRDPFGLSPEWDNARQRKRVYRLAAYCGAGIERFNPASLLLSSGTGSNYGLRTRSSTKRERRENVRSAATAMASHLKRLKTPLLRGSADFETFLGVWANHTQAVVQDRPRLMPVDADLHMELVHTGRVLLDISSSDNIYDARGLSRLAVCLNNIYGKDYMLDIQRLAHLPRSILNASGEEILSGSAIQKELQ